MLVLRMSRVGLLPSIGVLKRVRISTPLSRSLLSLAALTVGAAACKESADPAKVAAIVGLPAIDSVRLGKVNAFVVEARDASGNKLAGRKLNWSSLNPNIATVDASGVVTGVAIGSTVITARADGVTAQTDMRVQPLVASVVLSPSSATVPIGR
jgi:hypothetical protein